MKPKNVITLKNEDILFYAFRYALGRSTYAVEDVCPKIIKLIDAISEKTLKLIHEEICDADKNNRLGMPSDKKSWMKVKLKIEDKLYEKDYEKKHRFS